MPKFEKNIKLEPALRVTGIRHIAFIMDGNGRWAKARGLTRSLGHREGVKRIKEVALLCQEYGIEVMSLFCFSTENWKRPESEIQYLFNLLERFFKEHLAELYTKNIKIRILGDTKRLPISTQEAIESAVKKTEENTGFILNVCLNYGGRDEIVRAAKAIAEEIANKKMRVTDLDEAVFARHMMHNGLPDVDVMVRTSGEQRISNFMLWEIAYSELIFVKEHWPDFKKKQFLEVLQIYQQRNRRFGGIENGNK